MLRDYERLLQKLGPEHEGLIIMRRRTVELARGWKRLEKDCNEQFSPECRTKYRELAGLGRNIERMLLTFPYEKINFRDARVDGMVALSIGLGEIQRSIAQILHYLEEGIIFGGSDHYNHRYFVAKTNRLFKDLKFFSNTVMTGFLSKRIKKSSTLYGTTFFRS